MNDSSESQARRADQAPADAPPQPPAPVDAADAVDSRNLLRGARELRIRHEGQIYTLRVTRNGRLILNK